VEHFYKYYHRHDSVNPQQVKRWYQNQCRLPSAIARLSRTRNVSLRQVACHIYKREICAIASKRANGAEAGTPEFMSACQAAITEFMSGLDEERRSALEVERLEWQKRGQPPEVQRRMAERLAHTYFEKSVQVQYNDMGMRNIVLESHRNKAGMKLFQLYIGEIFLRHTYITLCRHDFNENLGNVKVQSFQAKFPEVVEQLKAAWVEYMKYCYRVEEGEEVESIAQNRPTAALMDLDRDVKGFPLVPPASEGDSLTYMKKVVRSFMTAHYRKFTKFILFFWSPKIRQVLLLAADWIGSLGSKFKNTQPISLMIGIFLTL